MKGEISYQGGTIGFEAREKGALPNDWKAFTIRSEDKAFIRVFNKEELELQLDPHLPYQPENDLAYEDRTPEQTILIKEVWDLIHQKEK